MEKKTYLAPEILQYISSYFISYENKVQLFYHNIIIKAF